jgi:hypothetical protein
MSIIFFRARAVAQSLDRVLAGALMSWWTLSRRWADVYFMSCRIVPDTERS